MQEDKRTKDAHEKWDYVGEELFTIRQACAACGLSRAMLIKLEQKGFVTPRKVDPSTGYRYYDMFDISRLQQYQTLRLMGLSVQEALEYYSTDAERREAILASMKLKLLALTRGVEELSVRLHKQEELRFSLLEFPDLTCYCKEAVAEKPEDMERVAFDAHTETVRRGWRMQPGEVIFTLRSASTPTSVPYHSKVCIPLDPESLGQEQLDGVEIIPGGTMLAVLYYGSYQGPVAFLDVIRSLFEEARQRNLTPTGPVRGYSIVAPYAGVEFEEDDFVFRFAVPVEI